VTTGISAQDRYETIRLFVDPHARPHDLVRPGHIFPIQALRGGVLVRAGHTEGSVDLARFAGLNPVAVICEIQNDDGSMARLPDLMKIAEKFNLPIATIKDLMAYRMEHEKLIKKVVTVHIPNVFGTWELSMYEDIVNNESHLAMVMGKVGPEPTLVRVHSQCFTGDTLGSLRCDCGPQLDAAMEKIAKEGRGVIVYMHQEGRGIGLKNKLLAYALQEQGKDTVEANEALGFKPDLREYGIGAQILADLGLKQIRIMTNNPRKIVGIRAFGLEVVERVPLEAGHHKDNAEYLRTKRNRLGHLIQNIPQSVTMPEAGRG
ncbi:GTP cyclohydrolase II, partial [Candidatus Sumerlaeota bacterium]|nr:GTP cyclohydrolase II [Candidatus Sumerlaeota bacterium]